jgi:nucleoside-diphosphate-sugar epimerase
MKAVGSKITGQSYFVTDGNQYTTKEFSNIVKSILHKKTMSIVFPKQIVKPIAGFLGIVSAITGKVSTLNPEKYKDISCKNWLCDSSDTFKDFGFKPEYNLEQGLTETIAWCKEKKLLK